MGGLEPPTQCARIRARKDNLFAAQTRGGWVACISTMPAD
jgi:hypothetical protein